MTDFVMGDLNKNSGIEVSSINLRQVHAIIASSVRFTFRRSSLKIQQVLLHEKLLQKLNFEQNVLKIVVQG